MQKILLGFALALAAAPAMAHDFWVQPDSFHLPAPATTPLTLQVGHGSERQRSQLPARRILRFDVMGPDGAPRDRRSDLTLGDPDADGRLIFDAPGGYVVALQSDDRAHSHLSQDRFVAYARDEGLTPALEASARTVRREWSERYSRNAKAIVQVGQGDTGAITRPLGLPLEIVPEAAPGSGADLTARILYGGQPLAGALVKLTDLGEDAQPRTTARTDPDGRVRFAAPPKGRWLLNVVWTEALPRSSTEDFETVFSSLAFAVP